MAININNVFLCVSKSGPIHKTRITQLLRPPLSFHSLKFVSHHLGTPKNVMALNDYNSLVNVWRNFTEGHALDFCPVTFIKADIRNGNERRSKIEFTCSG